MNTILFFNEINKGSRSLVGGKGANLGEMTQAKFPVPNGFCVSTEVYQSFIAANNLSLFIAKKTKGVDITKIERAGSQIRKAIQRCEIPASLAAAVELALTQFDAESYFSIRSSATAEDLDFASFAGQQDSYLNIKGKENILEAIRNCWASLYTDRAILYRIQNNIEHSKVSMSVVVQKMLLSEASGIMFTADPLNGSRDIVSIEAGYGLGEALVSGIISPDIYKFQKSTNRIIKKRVADKKFAIIPLAGGGTKKLELDETKSKTQVLDDEQIRKLVQIGLDIEKHYGSPQDIEWCMEDKELYIVQSRAISSLYPLPSPLPEGDSLRVYISLNHLQMMTDPISPLGLDIFRLVFRLGNESIKEYRPQIVTVAAGRMYADLSGLLKHKLARKILPVLLCNADNLMSTALKGLVKRPRFAKDIDRKTKKAPFIKLLYKMPFAVLSRLFWKDTSRALADSDAYIDAYIAQTKALYATAKSDKEKMELIFQQSALIKYIIPNALPNILSAVVSMKILGKMEKKLLGTEIYSNEISKGLEGNITTEMGLLVGDLADIARKSRAVLTELRRENYSTLFARLDKSDECADFNKAFELFLDKFGYRVAGEIDIAKEKWLDNPEPLVKSILAMVDTMSEGQHRCDYAKTLAKAKLMAIEFVEKVRTQCGERQAKGIASFVKLFRNCMPLREHHKYLMINIFGMSRKLIMEIAENFVAKKRIETKNDIFYLSFWEIDAALDTNDSFAEIVAKRKEDYAHYKKLTPPRVITSEGEEIKAEYSMRDVPEGAILGMPVSSGIVEGIAKVVINPTGAVIKKGEILVAPFTDPGWTTLFINASGLVTEVGGLLTHGTVVAREYGMPAVVGAQNATKLIKTGQRIRVNGNVGTIEILKGSQ